FRYYLSGTDTVRVELVNRTAKDTHVIAVEDLKNNEWAETTLDFTTQSKRGDGSEGKPRRGDRVDEIRFLLPRGAELLVDDSLLSPPWGVPRLDGVGCAVRTAHPTPW